MANFILKNGMFVKIIKPIPGVEVGDEYQVLYSSGIMGNYISFIGVNKIFSIKELAGCLEPVPSVL